MDDYGDCFDGLAYGEVLMNEEETGHLRSARIRARAWVSIVLTSWLRTMRFSDAAWNSFLDFFHAEDAKKDAELAEKLFDLHAISKRITTQESHKLLA